MLISDLCLEIIRRREGVEFVLVILAVAERDETLVLASVVPSQML